MPQGAPCPCAAAVCCGVTPSSAASSPARVRPKGCRRSSSGTGDLPAPAKGCGAGVPGRATAPAQIVPPARAIWAEPRRGRDGAMLSACPAILFQGGVAARLPSGCRSCSPSAVPGWGVHGTARHGPPPAWRAGPPAGARCAAVRCGSRPSSLSPTGSGGAVRQRSGLPCGLGRPEPISRPAFSADPTASPQDWPSGRATARQVRDHRAGQRNCTGHRAERQSLLGGKISGRMPAGDCLDLEEFLNAPMPALARAA